MSSSINKNAIFNTVKTIFGIIYPLITFPYISRVLMAENVGKVNFGNSIVSYFSLLASLGISTYAIRECSKVRDDKEQLEKTVSQIFSINLISTLFSYLTLAVTLIVARPLDNYRMLICIQSATIIFTTLGADWINSAMEDFKFIAIRTVGMQLVALLLMFIFIRNPEDYILYAIISVVASSGANIINFFYRNRFCKAQFTFKIDWRKHMPPIVLMFSMILAQTVYCNSDMTMLGLIRGDFEVGLYSTSVKIYTLVNQVAASIAWVVMPQLSAGFAKADFKKVNELLRYALGYIITLGLPCLAGVNIITKPLIGCIGGEEYIGASISLHILSLSLVCSFIGGWISNMMLIPSGKESICLKCGIVGAIVNVVLNIFIIPIWGLNGAAFTTFLSEFVVLFVLSRHIDKKIKIDNVFGLLKAPFIGSILILIIGIIVLNIFESYVLITIVTMIVSICLYAVVLYIFKNEFFMGYAVPVLNKLKRRRR